MSVKIIADSGCDLNDDLKKAGYIDVVPLTLQLDDDVYEDDSNLNITDYIKRMRGCKSYPKTAAPSPEAFRLKFWEGDSVFAVTISSALSATYNSALIAKDALKDELSKKFVHVFDSLSASVGETLIAMKIHELASKKTENIEIVNSINDYIKGMKTFFILNSYDNLAKNGRMNIAIAKLAKMLSIKLLCEGRNGKIELLDKSRGWKKALDRLFTQVSKDSKNIENKVFGISHVNSYEMALEIKNEIQKRFRFKEVMITEASGLCSTYAEEFGIIVAF